jgi:NIPSNAP
VTWHAGEWQAMLEPMEIELRDYRIHEGQMEAWIAGWKSHVVPLREAAGFRVIGAWVDPQHDRFIWLLGYAGDTGFRAADERYYASGERTALDPDPAALIDESTKTMVQAVL